MSSPTRKTPWSGKTDLGTATRRVARKIENATTAVPTTTDFSITERSWVEVKRHAPRCKPKATKNTRFQNTTSGKTAKDWSRNTSGIRSRLKRNQYAPSHATQTATASCNSTGQRPRRYRAAASSRSNSERSITILGFLGRTPYRANPHHENHVGEENNKCQKKEP